MEEQENTNNGNPLNSDNGNSNNSKPDGQVPQVKAAVSTPDNSKTAAAEAVNMPRRKFLNSLTVGWGAFIAFLVGAPTLFLRFMMPNVLFEPPQTFKAGKPDEYNDGEVSLRWKEKFGVWIVKDNGVIYALSTTCTHLGCTPNWLSGEAKFKCPCHGSGFRKSGINFEGPAPRPLERFNISLADDGQILINKNIKFQQEKGQWEDPESFLSV